MRLEWISLAHESQRHYPKGTLAAHVLGSVDFEEKGNAGIEKGLDEELRGKPGRTRLLTDVHRRGIDSPADHEPAKPGTSLTLTHRRAPAVRGGAGNRRGGARRTTRTRAAWW